MLKFCIWNQVNSRISKMLDSFALINMNRAHIELAAMKKANLNAIQRGLGGALGGIGKLGGSVIGGIGTLGGGTIVVQDKCQFRLGKLCHFTCKLTPHQHLEANNYITLKLASKSYC